MRLNSLFKKIEMTDKQESEFIDIVESDIKKYFRIPIYFIMLFQIYNIVYTSVYTGFTYRTMSSKIYMILYLMMFAVCVAGLIYLSKKDIPRGSVLKTQNYYIIFFILWSVLITIYDNRVSNNISVYIITVLSVAILVYLPPKVFVPLYLITELVLILGIEFIHFNDSLSNNYSIYVNSVWVTIMALYVGYYRYRSSRQNFLNQSIIVEKSEQLNFLATHDTLTGLQNRRYLLKILESIYLANKSDEHLTGVLIIDIDDFKLYNDYYGHVNGDDCLKRVADALNLCLSDGVLIRYGGEEFVCLLRGKDAQDVIKIGSNLCKSIERLNLKMPPNSNYECLTISVGATAAVLKGEEDWNNALTRADEALYEAKANNKNNCVLK